MEARDAARTAFLAANGWGEASLAWRPGDASFRRYARLTRSDGGLAMLMDAPPPRESAAVFVDIGERVGAMGVSVPTVLAADTTQGFLLLEDFGDDTFTALLDRGAAAQPLYELATDALLAFRRQSRAIGLPAYDAPSRVAHLATFLDWLWPEVMGEAPSPTDRATFDALWLDALSRAPTLGAGFVHRDFHVDNLMRLDGRNGLAACGVLDFQDAGAGPFAYDLASLLEDARRPLDPVLKQDCIARYRSGAPDLDGPEIAAALAVHGGQRHLRVAGLWVRLWRRDGKPGYLKHMTRTLDLLEASLTHSALADVRAFLDVKFPARARTRACRLSETVE